MAQFSSLEQTKSMQQDLASLRAQNQVLQSGTLLGQTVEVQVDEKTTVSGVVSAVHIQDGVPKITVDGKNYDIDQILSVMPTVGAA